MQEKILKKIGKGAGDSRKTLIMILLSVLVLALGGIVLYYWYNNTYFVTTEDARVTGDFVKANTQISGKLLELDLEEGDTVSRDQIIGRQEMSNLSGSNIEQSVVRAPIDGIVAKEQGAVGEFQAAGQTIAMLIDPQKLYVSANIEETKLEKVKPGQAVDITIDQFHGEKFTGTVKSVGQAANSAFSMLSLSSGGTFTKVVQRIPIKIQLNEHYDQLLPGTNAVIKIHVK